VLLKDFREWSMALTDTIRQSTHAIEESAGRPVIYLISSEDRRRPFANQVQVADAGQTCAGYSLNSNANFAGSAAWVICFGHRAAVVGPVRGQCR